MIQVKNINIFYYIQMGATVEKPISFLFSKEQKRSSITKLYVFLQLENN